jgi:hypothetical protein
MSNVSIFAPFFPASTSHFGLLPRMRPSDCDIWVGRCLPGAALAEQIIQTEGGLLGHRTKLLLDRGSILNPFRSHRALL